MSDAQTKQTQEPQIIEARGDGSPEFIHNGRLCRFHPDPQALHASCAARDTPDIQRRLAGVRKAGRHLGLILFALLLCGCQYRQKIEAKRPYWIEPVNPNYKPWLVTMLLALCLGLAGCRNHVDAIAEAAKRIDAAADRIERNTEQAAKTVEEVREVLRNPNPDLLWCDEHLGLAVELITGSRFEAREIRKAVASVEQSIPHIENKPGFFDGIKKFLVGAMWVAIIILLIYLGAPAILKKLMAWIPWLIPAPRQQQANMMVKLLDTNHKAVDPEAVVAHYRADPVNNAAFERQKSLIEQERAARMLAQAQEVVQP